MVLSIVLLRELLRLQILWLLLMLRLVLLLRGMLRGNVVSMKVGEVVVGRRRLRQGDGRR